MRHIFFAINFGFALLFLAAAVCGLGAMTSPGSLFGAVLIFPIAAMLAIGEWRVWYRHESTLETAIGVACLVLGGFILFGVICNVGEALQIGWPVGFGWLVLIALALASYFTVCGLCRVRTGASDRRSEDSGGKRSCRCVRPSPER